MILINIGDMLEFWTAGLLKSTWHRVVPTAQYGSVDRYTFAYFLHPNKDTVLKPIVSLVPREGWTSRYEGGGRTAEQHIHARIKGSGLSGDHEVKHSTVMVEEKEVWGVQ